MVPTLQDRAGQLAALGWTGHEAEWRRCCMKTLRGWGSLTRTSRDPPQEPRYRDEVEGPSHV